MAGVPPLEERMDDVRAVMDAAGSERAAILGFSEGGQISILFAATYPERTSALVLYGIGVAARRDDDYPWGRPPEEREAELDVDGGNWGTGRGVEHLRAEPRRRSGASGAGGRRFQRLRGQPGRGRRAAADEQRRSTSGTILPAIRVPTLILHRRGRPSRATVEAGRYLAAHIAGAKYVELDGSDHVPWSATPTPSSTRSRSS